MSFSLSSFFVDRAPDAIPPMLQYVTGTNNTDGEYVTSSLPNPAVTPATERIGTYIPPVTITVKTHENTDVVGAVRIGSVTIFENGEPAEQINIKTFDGFRTGKNIETFGQFGGGTNIRPMIRISPEGFFEKVEKDKINHFASFNNFGMGMHYKIVDEDYKLIPFNDFSQLIPKELIGREHVFAYPFIHDSRANLEQFIDPSHPGNDGAIDVFEVRYSLANLSPADIRVYGCHGSYQGGDVEMTRKGSTVIDSKFEVKKKSNSMFADSQDTQFSKFDFPKSGLTGSSGYKLSLPGFIDDRKYISAPYDDTTDHISGSYSFRTSAMQNFLSGSRNGMSEIGTRFKSSTCGLIFGESNKLGTDSIAFGGFKK